MGRRFEDITGRRFGKLTVVGFWYSEIEYGDRVNYYFCKCDCGKDIISNGRHLRYSKDRSCGCLFAKEHVKIIGKKFGRMTVVDFSNSEARSRNAAFLCKCDCGAVFYACFLKIIKHVITSCGCLTVATRMTRNSILSPDDLPHELVKLQMAVSRNRKFIKEQPAETAGK